MTLIRSGVVFGCLCCWACNPFGIDSARPGGPGPMAAPSASATSAPAGMKAGSVSTTGSVMPAAESAKPAEANGGAQVATGSSTSGVNETSTAPSSEAAPAASSADAPSSSQSTETGAATAGAAAPDGAAAEGAASSQTSGAAPAEGEAPAGGDAPAEGGESTGTTTTTEDPTGRAKGTAPLGTPVEEGGLECMNEVCLPLPPLDERATSMGFTLTLCCTPEGECGTISNDDPCRIIPDSNPECPRLQLMDFEVASCCTEDGKCGLNGEAFMMKPCGSLEEAIDMFGEFIEFPEPRPCTPAATTPPATTDTAGQTPAADAGVSMTP